MQLEFLMFLILLSNTSAEKDLDIEDLSPFILIESIRLSLKMLLSFLPFQTK